MQGEESCEYLWLPQNALKIHLFVRLWHKTMKSIARKLSVKTAEIVTQTPCIWARGLPITL